MRITEKNLRGIIRRQIAECGDWDPETDGDMDAYVSDDSDDRPFDAPDEEMPGYMLIQNLAKIAEKAADLAKLATPLDDAEPWVESKINSAAQHIDAIHDYIMYAVNNQAFDSMDHEDMMFENHMNYGVDRSVKHLSGRDMGEGGPARMAKGQLFNIAKKAQSLHDTLSDDDTLPEWVQAYVNSAFDYMGTIDDYLSYKMHRAGTGNPVAED
jgi:hypothetical protein